MLLFLYKSTSLAGYFRFRRRSRFFQLRNSECWLSQLTKKESHSFSYWNHTPTNMLTDKRLEATISGSAGWIVTSVWISSLHIQASLVASRRKLMANLVDRSVSCRSWSFLNSKMGNHLFLERCLVMILHDQNSKDNHAYLSLILEQYFKPIVSFAAHLRIYVT